MRLGADRRAWRFLHRHGALTVCGLSLPWLIRGTRSASVASMRSLRLTTTSADPAEASRFCGRSGLCRRKQSHARVLLAQDVRDARGGGHVERARGLVGQDQRRLGDERPHDRDALALPNRQLRWPRVWVDMVEADTRCSAATARREARSSLGRRAAAMRGSVMLRHSGQRGSSDALASWKTGITKPGRVGDGAGGGAPATEGCQRGALSRGRRLDRRRAAAAADPEGPRIPMTSPLSCGEVDVVDRPPPVTPHKALSLHDWAQAHG